MNEQRHGGSEPSHAPALEGSYRSLQPAKIVETLHRLHARISERFKGSGLSKVSRDLIAVAEATSDRVDRLAKPYLGLRAAIALIIAAGIAVGIRGARNLPLDGIAGELPALVQGLEAFVNLLVICGAAVLFLVTLEERWKRARVLKALHELRSLAHVVDMHQLTKDPTIVLNGRRTASSPVREMSKFELARYLDYCAELLALIGKLAALYAERSRDAVIIEAVNDLESLTTDLGRKIWQKIMILGELEE